MIPFLHLGTGKTFGELALIQQDNGKTLPRAATVVARTDCIFAVLKKKDF